MTAMKQISFGVLAVVLSVVLNLAAVVWSQETAMGRPLGRAGSSIKRAGCAGTFGPKCADCNTILTCANTEINSQPCSSINPKKPYCVNNACSEVPLPGCTLPFTCTGSGLFPDPNDCKRYYLCESPAGKSVTYECPPPFVYDSRSGLCKRSSICQAIDCSKSSNTYIAYPSDRSIMAYCQNVANKKQTILFRCADSENMEYNLNTLKCEFKCKNEGRFLDRLDCHKFYECYRSYGFGFDLKHMHESCPEGFWYNQLRSVCERRATCQPEIPQDEIIDEGSGGGVFLLF